MDILADLNQAQLQAATMGDGPLLIVAGPGTGKTKTLTARMAHLLLSGKARAGDIVALTFTNKAAAEMRARLAAALGAGVALPDVSTFHALGQRLLRRQRGQATLISEQERAEVIRDLPRPAALKGLAVRELALMLSRAKTSLKPPADQAVQQLLDAYNTQLRAANVFDFDDLLRETYHLLLTEPATRPGYRYLLVDEFQDTSELQYELLRLLGAGDNIFAIGDPRQAIYSFRGAGADVFARLRADYPYARTITLTDNYRSAARIVQAANAVFPQEPPLCAQSRHDGRLEIIEVLNEYAEAAFILNEIERGIGGSNLQLAHADHEARQPRDYAVLYRTHRAALAVQRRFAEAGLPYQVAGEGSPYEQPGAQALIALLGFFGGPPRADGVAALARLPAFKSVSASQLETLLATVPFGSDTPVADLAARLVTLFDLSRHGKHDLQPLLNALVQFGAGSDGLARAAAHFARLAESEFYDPGVNAVTLLTIHASKGLEFDRIFLCAAEDGILPHVRKSEVALSLEQLAEERRLFYVALTRAKTQATILHARTRAGQPAKLSRFVAALPQSLVPRVTDPALQSQHQRQQKLARKRAQTSLFG